MCKSEIQLAGLREHPSHTTVKDGDFFCVLDLHDFDMMITFEKVVPTHNQSNTVHDFLIPTDLRSRDCVYFSPPQTHAPPCEADAPPPFLAASSLFSQSRRCCSSRCIRIISSLE